MSTPLAAKDWNWNIQIIMKRILQEDVNVWSTKLKYCITLKVSCHRFTYLNFLFRVGTVQKIWSTPVHNLCICVCVCVRVHGMYVFMHSTGRLAAQNGDMECIIVVYHWVPLSINYIKYINIVTCKHKSLPLMAPTCAGVQPSVDCLWKSAPCHSNQCKH